ncbi:MAG TPA: acyl-phosphate glycerol 3-phosphate acyltransferase, partial [Alphaproteobacteria bacterium]|nr:acyl-phosphate glycerol 3-phosphate acyltransferase [Alphaproteobacteria bacterium]
MPIAFPDPISWSMSGPYYLAALAGGYLLGSIPFSYLIAQWFGHGDIRNIGSGNVGATNVLRTGDKRAAALALLGDLGKAALAVQIGKYFGNEIAFFTALGAFTGHVFPVWLRFQGGKGVATYAGTLLALDIEVFLVSMLTWVGVALLTRISSLSALVTALLVPVYMALDSQPLFAGLTLLLGILVYITHRSNIARL